MPPACYYSSDRLRPGGMLMGSQCHARTRAGQKGSVTCLNSLDGCNSDHIYSTLIDNSTSTLPI